MGDGIMRDGEVTWQQTRRDRRAKACHKHNLKPWHAGRDAVFLSVPSLLWKIHTNMNMCQHRVSVFDLIHLQGRFSAISTYMRPPHFSAVVGPCLHRCVYNTTLKHVLFIVSPSAAERGSWMGGWTIKGAVTLIYFCVRRQSSGTHRYSVGENPDSIHRSLSSLPSLDLFRVSMSLSLATALAVNGDTNVLPFIKASWKKNESVIMKYLAILILLSACWSLLSPPQATPVQNYHLHERRTAEAFYCTSNHVQNSNRNTLSYLSVWSISLKGTTHHVWHLQKNISSQWLYYQL